MLCFVVMSGEEFPEYQFAFSFVLAVFSVVCYGIIHFVMYRFEKKYWNRNVFKLENTVLVGLYWSANYVFALVSNPFTPGLVQVH
jgi:hypothetical protein